MDRGREGCAQGPLPPLLLGYGALWGSGPGDPPQVCKLSKAGFFPLGSHQLQVKIYARLTLMENCLVTCEVA